MSLAGAGARSGALEAVERLLNRESEADVILREAVAVVRARLEARWVGIAFVEAGGLELGPLAGEPGEDPEPDVRAPVDYRGSRVAELQIGGAGRPDDEDRAFLGRLCALLSPYCLVGWDTRGEAWEP